MSGFGQRFVVDTNTLSQIGRRRRTSAFFQEHAVIPEDVLLEAAAFPDIDALRRNSAPTVPGVLEMLIKILATVDVDDTTLIDLYANKGGADPLVVAHALHGQSRDGAFLVAPDWVVVSGDTAVRNLATKFGLPALTNADFAATIDASARSTPDDHFGAFP